MCCLENLSWFFCRFISRNQFELLWINIAESGIKGFWITICQPIFVCCLFYFLNFRRFSTVVFLHRVIAVNKNSSPYFLVYGLDECLHVSLSIGVFGSIKLKWTLQWTPFFKNSSQQNEFVTQWISLKKKWPALIPTERIILLVGVLYKCYWLVGTLTENTARNEKLWRIVKVWV